MGLVQHVQKRFEKSLHTLKTHSFRSIKTDVAFEYAFLQREPIGSEIAAAGAAPNSINWIVPPFFFRTDRHLNIFRFVQMLERRGFECRVVIDSGACFGTPDEARARICAAFMPIEAEVYIGIQSAPPSIYTVATGWQTAYLAARFQATRHRCYFVQDFEPWFYPMGTDYVLAEDSYRLGLTGITNGDWLRDKLKADFGMETHSVGFSVDREIYFPDYAHAVRTHKKIFFCARPAMERRAFELGVLILAQVKRRMPDVEIILTGGELDAYSLPFACTAKGNISPNLLGALYRECDLGLVLSFTNLLPAPLELMACGTPVVSNRGPNTEWCLSDAFCCLVRPRIAEATEAICRLLSDDVERTALREAGIRNARRTSWEHEADKLAAMLYDLAARRRGELSAAFNPAASDALVSAL